MALKVLMLRKKINTKTKELEALRAKDAEFETREAELETSINEAETEEERSAVDEAIDAFNTEKKEHEDGKAELERTIADLEEELAAEEAAQDTTPPAEKPAAAREHVEVNNMAVRSRVFANMTLQERSAFVENESVKNYLGEVRAAIKEKRALTNVGLTIPEVMLGVLRQNIEGYSKLYKRVTVRSISGEGRMIVMGAIPEAVWTECCATLNELALTFNDVTVDCFKVAGYFVVCNANLEDSDLNLAAELMDAIGQAIGLALDKAILYGRNSATAQNMPQGIVSRLVQTEAPTGYPATARPWADLHTSNVISITAANSTGIKLFQSILAAAGNAKGKYARGGKTWLMNETTHTKLMSEAMSINAAGAVVSGVNGTMPVIGGDIEELDFIPDNVIIGGYFEDYLLAERRGQQFAQSEHVKFLQDQTVLKGTARYDGTPVIAEAFVVIGIAGTTPNATMTFAADTAN